MYGILRFFTSERSEFRDELISLLNVQVSNMLSMIYFVSMTELDLRAQ